MPDAERLAQQFGGVSRLCFLSVRTSDELVDDDPTRHCAWDDTRPSAFSTTETTARRWVVRDGVRGDMERNQNAIRSQR